MNIQSSPSTNRPLAVVTGASSGIGYELARTFAENKFDLIVAAEDEGIFEVVSTFRDLGAEVQAVQADLATEEGVETLFRQIEPHMEFLDSVAMNAGVGVCGEFTQISLEEELNLVNLNVISVLRLTKKILPTFVARGHGRILYTSSIAAEMPGPYYAVYAASKAFLQSFSEAIRAEVKDKGVTITALQPGATDTNFFERAHMMDTKAGVGRKDDPAIVAKDGFNALMEGKDHVIAGSFRNTAQSTIAKFVSQQVGAKIQGKQIKPGSAQH